MNKLLTDWMNSTKMNLLEAAAYAKERIHSLTGISSNTLGQLAEFIQSHPDTKIYEKNLLGLPFTFYVLDEGDVYCRLEIRRSHILQLDVRILNHQIADYRSYRDQSKLDAPIRFLKRT